MRFGLLGLLAAFVALLGWVAAPGPSWLDVLVLLAFAVGAGLAVRGFLRGATLEARRVAVIAIGVNALGILGLILLYAAG